MLFGIVTAWLDVNGGLNCFVVYSLQICEKLPFSNMMSDDDRDNDIESDADKRAHHNALERKRRDHIKDSFTSLREALPAMTGEKASRAQILKRAADYISQMRRKNNSHQNDIEDLKKQNKTLEDQIRQLEKAKTTGNYAAAGALEVSPYNSRSDGISAYDGGSGTDSSESDGSRDGRRKKLKTNQNNVLY